MNNFQSIVVSLKGHVTNPRAGRLDLIYSSTLTASLMIIRENISGTQLSNPFISGGGLETATVLFGVTL